MPSVAFLHLLKTSENLWYSEVLREHKKTTVDSNGLLL